MIHMHARTARRRPETSTTMHNQKGQQAGRRPEKRASPFYLSIFFGSFCFVFFRFM
jgi:hypothetical protein